MKFMVVMFVNVNLSSKEWEWFQEGTGLTWKTAGDGSFKYKPTALDKMGCFVCRCPPYLAESSLCCNSQAAS
jgi:hypothetical protein